MIGDLHFDKDRQAQPDFFRRDEGDAPQNDALLFQTLDTFPARRLRQADFVGQFGDGNRRVSLQGGKDFAINRIHPASLSGCACRAARIQNILRAKIALIGL